MTARESGVVAARGGGRRTRQGCGHLQSGEAVMAEGSSGESERRGGAAKEEWSRLLVSRHGEERREVYLIHSAGEMSSLLRRLQKGSPTAPPGADRLETVGFLKNLQREDWVVTPLLFLQFVSIFALLAFLDEATSRPTFGRDWIYHQLDALGGYNATIRAEYRAAIYWLSLQSSNETDPFALPPPHLPSPPSPPVPTAPPSPSPPPAPPAPPASPSPLAPPYAPPSPPPSPSLPPPRIPPPSPPPVAPSPQLPRLLPLTPPPPSVPPPTSPPPSPSPPPAPPSPPLLPLSPPLLPPPPPPPVAPSPSAPPPSAAAPPGGPSPRVPPTPPPLPLAPPSPRRLQAASSPPLPPPPPSPPIDEEPILDVDGDVFLVRHEDLLLHNLSCSACLEANNLTYGSYEWSRAAARLREQLLLLPIRIGIPDPLEYIQNHTYLNASRCDLARVRGNATCVPMQLPYEWNMDGIFLAPHALARVLEVLEQTQLPPNVTLTSNLEAWVFHVLYEGAERARGPHRVTPRREYDDLMEPFAVAQLDAWAALLDTLNVCFGGAAAFLVLGLFFNLGLVMSYFYSERMRTSVQSPLLADDPLSASLICLIALINATFLNALTQDKKGYYIVRWQSAIAHVVWHGIPIIAIASTVLAALDCGERPCKIGVPSTIYDSDYFPVFCLVVSVPVIVGQLANAAMSFGQQGHKSTPSEPVSQADLDLVEPKVAEMDSFGSVFSISVSIVICFLLWICQLLAIIGMFENMEERVRGSYLQPLTDLGLRGPVLYLPGYNNGDLEPNGGWGFIVPNDSWRVGLSFWCIGMTVNLVAVGSYVGGGASRSLKLRMQQSPVVPGVCVLFSLMHPEFMLVVAERRKDMEHFMQLGAVSAITTNIPLFFIFFDLLVTKGGTREPFVILMTMFTLLHSCFYCIRAGIILITKNLRRPSNLKTFFLGQGDYALLLVAAVQLVLVLMLSICCIQGSSKGKACVEPFEPGSGGLFDDFNRTRSIYEAECETLLPPETTSALSWYFFLIIFFVAIYGFSNLFASISFLNHFRFSHQWISDHPFTSTCLVTLGIVDAQWLNGLAQEQNIRLEVKRTAMFTSLCFLCPLTVIQVSIAYFTSVDWGKLNDTGMIFSPTSTSAFSFALTVLTAVARLLMFVVLVSTRRAQGHEYSGETDLIRHALCCCFDQWKRNRRVPEGFVVNGGQFGLGGGGFQSPDQFRQRPVPQADTYADETELAQAQAEYEGYQNESQEYDRNAPAVSDQVDGDVGNGYPVQNLDAGFESVVNDANPIMEAVCLKRALFMTPDGYQGVFVALPTAPDQPIPFLFVQALEIRQLKKRFGNSRSAQVAFTFNSADVGGLDAEFIQQNVYNDPHAAWQQLEELDRSNAQNDDPAVEYNDDQPADLGEPSEAGLHVDYPSTWHSSPTSSKQAASPAIIKPIAKPAASPTGGASTFSL
ncbi:hypothetical protein AB1Y20_007343 [Prymnesium parvum]|uniref:Uncharacterized protein n=1 Tax=Prymnesium parvum TaxID=97485 RepID=A0AB34IUX3_PRYPA